MAETLCFVVMPFRPELNYFFLYLKRYLEEKYRIRVDRGDSKVLTKELLKGFPSRLLRHPSWLQISLAITRMCFLNSELPTRRISQSSS